MFNFWWSAGLVDGLESRPPPLSSQKIEMLMFGLRWTSDDQPGWSSSTFYNLPHPLPLPFSDSVPEQETGKFQFQMDIYVYIYMDSNPICHPSQPNKMKCSFLDYVQLLMIGQAGRWTGTPSTTSLQPKIWNAHFRITFNFWWSAGLVDGLEPHLPPLPTQKKWNAHFWIAFNFWWLAGLVNGLEPHLPPLSSQKNEMLILGLRSTSDDWLGVDGLEPCPPPHSSQKSEMLIFESHSPSDDQPGWLMDSNPICHPSPPKKNEMLIFGLHLPSDDWPGWSMELNPICHPSLAKKVKCSFLDYVQLLMISQAGQWTWIPPATPL